MNLYLTLLHTATKDDEPTDIAFDQTTPIIKNATEWKVSVERLQVYTNHVPSIIGECLIHYEDHAGRLVSTSGIGTKEYSDIAQFVNYNNLKWVQQEKLSFPTQLKEMFICHEKLLMFWVIHGKVSLKMTCSMWVLQNLLLLEDRGQIMMKLSKFSS